MYPQRRTSIVLTAAVGLALLAASAWCISAVRTVTALRDQVDLRIDIVREVEAIATDLAAAERPDELAIISTRTQELARTLAVQRGSDDPALIRARAAAQQSTALVAITEHADAPPTAARAAVQRELEALAPELRAETRRIYAELGEHWDTVYLIAALAIGLGGLTTLLLGYLLCVAVPRMRETDERIHRLATRLAGTPSANGISHGVGGPLTTATTSLQLLRERIAPHGAREEMQLLDDAIHALARATGTLQDLRGTSYIDDERESGEAERPFVPLRILLIDDDEMVAVSTKRVLAGHTVETERDGGRGIARALTEPFDLILCDLMMPGQSGIDVYRCLQKERPAMLRRFVVVSGGANDEEAAVFLDEYRGLRLDKPFGTKQLRELVGRFRPRKDARAAQP